MSYRGRGGSNYRGRNSEPDLTNPDSVLEYGSFVHKCENVYLFKVLDGASVPKFSSPVFLKNKTLFGKVDEVLGPINESYITVVPLPAFSSGFQKGDICYISPDRLLKVQMFLEEPAPKRGGGRGGGRGRGRGGARGRGGYSRGKSSQQPASRGNYSGRGGNRGRDFGRRNSFDGGRGGQRGRR